MAKLKVRNQLGEEVGEVSLSKDVFGVKVNDQALFDAVQVYLANARQATAKTKVRSEVRGGGKKPWKQKGTGRARQGSRRAPQWRGGGTVFGPDGNQSYKLQMNKKVRELALKSALTEAAKRITVVEAIKFEKASTKEFKKLLDVLNVKGKTLVVVDEECTNIEALLSATNLSKVNVLFYDEINTYEILNHDSLVFTSGALKNIEEAYK